MARIDISLVDKISSEINSIISTISELPGCHSITALPDIAMSNHETPHALVTAFKEYVVPQLIGRTVNCGMAVIKLNIDPKVIKDNSYLITKAIHEHVNNTFIEISNDTLEQIYKNGPMGITNAVPDLKGHIEESVKKSVNLKPFLRDLKELDEIVPPRILKNKKTKRMPGQVIFGNHFIEFSKGSILEKRKSAEYFGEETFCSFHCESNFSGRVNSYYSGTRKKDRDNNALRKPKTWLRYCEKALFHLSEEGILRSRDIFKFLLRNTNFVPIPINSISGQRFLSAVQLQMNYERANRFVMAKKIIESIEEVLGYKIDWEIIFEGGHNTFHSEIINDDYYLVARKTLVKSDFCNKGYIAGMYNIPSMLVESKKHNVFTRWCNSYDHGIGNNLWRDVGFDNYKNNQVRGDVARYEEVLRAVRGSSEDWDSRGEKLGVCEVFRPNGISDKEFPKSEKHDVRIGPALRFFIEQYSTSDSPVVPLGLLIPFVNYKVRKV